MKEVVAGIDIGGTNTVYGLVDKEGTIILNSSISTSMYNDFDSFLKALYSSMEKSVNSLDEKIKLIGIGIGAPNGNYYNGSIEFAPNLKWKGIINVVEEFKKYCDLPVFLTNDANAAAMGEMIYGSAKGMKDFIFMTLGTGVGSGIVANGKLIYGHDGFAGEIGHTIVYPDGRDCACGRKGCLETYTSAGGIKRTVAQLLNDRKKNSLLRKIDLKILSAKDISDAANKGDELALEAFEMTGKILGLKLTDAVAHTSPEAIFIFGGLAQAGDLIFNPVKKYFEEYLLNIYKNKVKILQSGLEANNAAILGAAALVLNEL